MYNRLKEIEYLHHFTSKWCIKGIIKEISGLQRIEKNTLHWNEKPCCSKTGIGFTVRSDEAFQNVNKWQLSTFIASHVHATIECRKVPLYFDHRQKSDIGADIPNNSNLRL